MLRRKKIFYINIYKVEIDDIAKVDISVIHDYIYYNLYNPIVAKSYMDNIMNKIKSLKRYPYRGAIYFDEFQRFIIYKNFLILYKIQEKEKVIKIQRIISKRVNK